MRIGTLKTARFGRGDMCSVAAPLKTVKTTSRPSGANAIKRNSVFQGAFCVSDELPELACGLAGYGFRITMSTRLLRARPSAFSFELTGWYSAKPAAESRFGSKP